MAGADSEIDRIAREMIAEHGPQAARIATERLNEMIDRNNTRARDLWACVVQMIHQCQGTGPIWTENPDDQPHDTARPETAPQ